MKHKSGYLLRDIAGQTIVVPIGAEAISFNGILTLNKTGKSLWNALETDQTIDSLVDVLTSKFEVDPATAKADALAFLQKLEANRLLA